MKEDYYTDAKFEISNTHTENKTFASKATQRCEFTFTLLIQFLEFDIFKIFIKFTNHQIVNLINIVKTPMNLNYSISLAN